MKKVISHKYWMILSALCIIFGSYVMMCFSLRAIVMDHYAVEKLLFLFFPDPYQLTHVFQL